MQRSSPVPPELSDIIIDHLYDDRRALAACSLVCKSWLYTSRHHLFRSIDLDSVNAQLFLHLLKSSCATFIHTTTRLHISDEDYFIPQNVDYYGLLKDIPALTALKALKLKGVTWSGSQLCPDQSVFVSSTITNLVLDNVEFDDLHDLVTLISGIWNLEELHVDVQIWNFEAPYMGKQRVAPSLRAINVVATRGAQHILDWFSKDADQTSLERVCLHRLTVDDLVSAGHLLGKVGDQLHELELSFDESSGTISAAHMYNLLDLSVNTCLERLYLHLDPRESIYQASSLHGNLAWFISRVSGSLESLMLDIVAGEQELINWEELAAILSHRRFCNLQNVAVRYEGKVEDILHRY